jgi:hypothetical protein
VGTSTGVDDTAVVADDVPVGGTVGGVSEGAGVGLPVGVAVGVPVGGVTSHCTRTWV